MPGLYSRGCWQRVPIPVPAPPGNTPAQHAGGVGVPVAKTRGETPPPGKGLSWDTGVPRLLLLSTPGPEQRVTSGDTPKRWP